MNKHTHHSLGNDAVILTTAKCITMLVSLVTSMLLSRFRTLDEYGTYSQLQTVVNLAVSVFTLGLPNCINYFLARAVTSKERRDFLSVYYSFSTILCIGTGIVLVAAVPLIESYYDNPLICSFAYVMAILPWTKVTISGISNVLVVYQRTVKLAVLNIANAVLALTAVITVKLFNWSFGEYMILYIIAELIMTVWIYVIVFRAEGHLNIKFNKSVVKNIFTYSVPLGFSAMVGTVTLEMDKLMIGYLLDTESVAIYANAGKELPLTILATSLTAVLLPQMAKKLKAKDTHGAVALWGNTIRLSYIIMAFFVTACIAFAPQIIAILYSEKYLLGVNVFRIYALVLLLRTTYFGIILNSIGKTRHILYCSLISLVINVLLNYLLFVLLGFPGPAISSFISIFIISGTQLFISAREIKIPIRDIFPWLQLLKITVINTVWGIGAYVLIRILRLGTDTVSIIKSIAIGMIITIIYFLVMKKTVKSLWRNLNSENQTLD